MATEHDSEASSPPASVGERLRAARTGRGWSVEQVAARLRIRPELLQALERDDHAAFGALTYARGQLRNYLRLLDLDEPASLQQAPPPVAPAPAKLARRTPELHPRRPWLVRLGGLAIIGVLAVLGAQWARDGHQPTPAAEISRPLAPAAPAVDAPAADVDTAVPPPAPATTATADVAAGPPAPATGAEPGRAPVAPAEPASAPADGRDELRLSTRAVSWVEITDHTGQRLVYELVSPGTPRSVRGVPPLRVLLGNAPAVELLYNGAPVALPPGQHVVRLTLGTAQPPAAGSPPAAAPTAPTP
jgi:cytoskeleton protein RodZ